jgi:hypothetical protein
MSRRGHSSYTTVIESQRPPDILAANGDVLRYDVSKGDYEPIYVQTRKPTKKRQRPGNERGGRTYREKKGPRVNPVIVIDLGYRPISADEANVSSAEELKHADGDIVEMPMAVRNMCDAARRTFTKNYTSKRRGDDRTRYGKWSRLYGRSAYVATYDPDLQQSNVYRMRLADTGDRDKNGNRLYRLSNPFVYMSLFEITTFQDFLDTEMVKYVMTKRKQKRSRRNRRRLEDDDRVENTQDDDFDTDDDQEEDIVEEDEDGNLTSYDSPVHSSDYSDLGFERVTL